MTIDKLRDSERRVISMAMIHEQLYQQADMSSIDLAKYVRELAARLFCSLAPSALITYRLDVISTELTIEQSIPCGLILNELITNALKYAYPEGEGEISIVVRTHGDCVRMTVSDQGIGLPTGFDLKNKFKSLGMDIVQLLTVQLGGQLETGPSPGASFTVSFPKLPLGRPAMAVSHGH